MRDPFVVPDKFIMALDMDAGRLGFMAHNEWLGWAFGDFQGKELFPAVSCVWGHCEVTLKYLNYSHSPLSLQVSFNIFDPINFRRCRIIKLNILFRNCPVGVFVIIYSSQITSV